MLAQITSFTNIGLQCHRIAVEVACARGEDRMVIVGLGDTAVKESKQRVWMALRSANLRIPTGRTITINLAPADLRKVGPRFDLAMALGIVATNNLVEFPEDLWDNTAFLGELALDGSIRHVSGVLPAAIACKQQGIKRIVVPESNGAEAALIPEVEVVAVSHISQLIPILTREQPAPKITRPASAVVVPERCVDFADVRGQHACKRALEIAAAGGHNVLMSGAPGAGKTLLAKAFRGILPPLTEEESIEIMQIYSVANQLCEQSALQSDRPFRTVHHTASGVSIVGGGQVPGPGEISLAHKGVLFLDELAEFPTQVLEVLRQPLEDRSITITRANGTVTFPADFILVAAMNPPKYSSANAKKIARRISPPLLDRIDLTIDVQPVAIEDLQRKPEQAPESSATIAARVQSARKRQKERFAETPLRTNNEMGVKQIDALCTIDDASKQLLRQAVDKMGLSARAYHRTIKVARTIADLADCDHIAAEHIAEALQYRQSVDY